MNTIEQQRLQIVEARVDEMERYLRKLSESYRMTQEVVNLMLNLIDGDRNCLNTLQLAFLKLTEALLPLETGCDFDEVAEAIHQLKIADMQRTALFDQIYAKIAEKGSDNGNGESTDAG